MIEITEKNVNILPKGKENVIKVLEIIREKGIEAKILGHPQTAVNSLQTHLSLYGGTAENVLKCLCVVSKGRPIVVMASGEVKIDFNKLSKVSHMKEIRMAREDELEQLFGRMPGGVDPLTIPQHIPVFADEKLFEKEWVVGSSGSPYAGLKIKPSDILKCREVQVADLAL